VKPLNTIASEAPIDAATTTPVITLFCGVVCICFSYLRVTIRERCAVIRNDITIEIPISLLRPTATV